MQGNSIGMVYPMGIPVRGGAGMGGVRGGVSVPPVVPHGPRQ